MPSKRFKSSSELPKSGQNTYLMSARPLTAARKNLQATTEAALSLSYYQNHVELYHVELIFEVD